jgi:hypothetical protein
MKGKVNHRTTWNGCYIETKLTGDVGEYAGLVGLYAGDVGE